MVKAAVEWSWLNSLFLTIALWLRATLFQWLQIFIHFLICSYAPLCPTWLSGCLPNWDKKSPSATFSQELQDWQEAYLRASGELKRALSSSHLQGVHCFSALPHLSAAASCTLRTCDLHGEGGWADDKSLSHMWYCREKTVGQGGRRERWLTGMRISAVAAFDIDMGNNLEKKEPRVRVWATEGHKPDFGIGIDLSWISVGCLGRTVGWDWTRGRQVQVLGGECGSFMRSLFETALQGNEQDEDERDKTLSL